MMKQANSAATYSVLEKMAKEADDSQWVTLEGNHKSELRNAGLTRSALGTWGRMAGKGVGFGLLGAVGGGLLGALAGGIGGNANVGSYLGGNLGMLGGSIYGTLSSLGNSIDAANTDVAKGIQEGYLRIGKDGKLQIRKDYL